MTAVHDCPSCGCPDYDEIIATIGTYGYLYGGVGVDDDTEPVPLTRVWCWDLRPCGCRILARDHHLVIDAGTITWRHGAPPATPTRPVKVHTEPVTLPVV